MSCNETPEMALRSMIGSWMPNPDHRTIALATLDELVEAAREFEDTAKHEQAMGALVIALARLDDVELVCENGHRGIEVVAPDGTCFVCGGRVGAGQ